MKVKMEKLESKLCGVCGDRALGYNFNAITCESCKAFFRRNALIQKQFKCPFDNQCDITQITRRFCQKCRLDKCFNIGMCKDLIMSEEDKVLKRQKIEENRAKKRTTSSFKQSFKKVKKDSLKLEQDTDSLINSYTDSDSKETVLSEQCYTPNNPSIMNYPSPQMQSESNFNLNISSPADGVVSSSDDVSMIRRMLNASSNVHVTENEPSFIDISPKVSEISNIPSYVSSDKASTPETSSNYQESSSFNNVGTSNNAYYSDNINSSTDSQRDSLDVTKDVVHNVNRLNKPGDSGSIDSILCEAIKLEYEAYSAIAGCVSNSRELNDSERAKLNELIVANKALLSPVDEELSNLCGKEDDCKFRALLQTNPQQALEADPALVDVINLTAIVIRRLIKMAKKINAFKNMCQEDQVALLKGGCTEIMILRSAMNYDPTKQTWKIPHSQALNLNVDVLKLAKGNMYQEHERFIKTFDPKWRSDENIILILCAIVLFTPDRQRVIHQDVIKLEQNSYYYLLRRYLESIYAGCEAKSTFLKLIQKIAELHKLNEELINIYLDVNPQEVEPLLIEIFDLKH